MPDEVLAVSDLRVAFAGSAADAVDGVELRLVPGQVTALVGESGSGKSVSARALLGLLPESAQVSGSAELADQSGREPLQLLGASRKLLNQVRGARVAMVFQEPITALNPLLRIGAQIDEIMMVHEGIPRAQARARSLELLAEVSLREPERIYQAYPHQVSGGQLQRAFIAMALACRPDVLIADEPTTALDMTAQATILQLLREAAHARNLGVLLITHDMGVVADLADQVIVLQQGKVVEAGPVEQVFYQPQAEYTRRLLASVPRLGQALTVAPSSSGGVSDAAAAAAVQALLDPVRDGAEDGAEDRAEDGSAPAVEIENLTVIYGSGSGATRAVNQVSLRLEQGEVLALVGESGSGKSTISATIYGQVRASSGQVKLAGTNILQLRGRALRRSLSRIGVVFQNPASALNPRRTVVESIAEPLRTHTKLSPAQRRERALQAMLAARLETAYADRYPHELSGGQRQRVAIARAIVLRPSLVIADEPTSALDVSVQAQVLATLQQLQQEMGFACLLITHDLAVVEQLAERVVVLKQGEVVEADTTTTVLAQPESPYTQRLLDAVPVPDPRVQAQRRARFARHDLS
ncbi:hypothetical protein BM477_07225 [Boudabousia marimammalium]|uniref:ABC transporter domain-containing protein n=1 Tax=Boudabousia marimammalium TaxID=156892 RepID=A0A1Q5PKK5_9ACTO|nr:hypothetical protein BM477_07225 [Boudabousia marimammalium]